MAPRSPMRTVATCAAALVLVLAGCGMHKGEPGVDEPAREGLAIDVAGIYYNVFITRPLNLRITPDKAYYPGPGPAPGRELWGVFLDACNVTGGGSRTPTDDFVVEDNQGNEYEPIEIPEDNAWAFHPRPLAKGDCIPEAGSVAEQGPTKGSLIIFDFSLETTENRPLELHIKAFDAAKGEPVTKTIELDL
jgi:hypothetical protein